MTRADPIQAERHAGTRWMDRETALFAGRLAALLRESGAAADEAVTDAAEAMERDARGWAAEPADPPPPPLSRLIRGLRLDALDVDLLLLAGLGEYDERHASLMTMLHPFSRPWPTAGLAQRLLAPGDLGRPILRERLARGPLARLRLLRCEGEDLPLPLRDLRVESAAWSLLQGVPALIPPLASPACAAPSAGLDDWFGTPEADRARALLRRGAACTVAVVAREVETALHRAVALCREAGVACRALAAAGPDAAPALAAQSLLAGEIPVLRLPDGDAALPAADLEDHPGPLVLAGREGALPDPGGRPSLTVPSPRLSFAAAERMWTRLAPALEDDAKALAARFAMEPFRAARCVGDLACRGEPPTPGALVASLRDRSAQTVPHSVDLIRPVAGWPQLVLPEAQIGQLKDAAARLEGQSRVLGDWRFLADRRGARGVRLLFSGPPGTGKTLAAEVLARSLGVDLMVGDLSRMVSKWIGETEKNLAQVFNAAEETHAVLFFDEADALFGKRTEVADAHDRNANLETAYLLSRLERYDGLAVLATNFRRNLDAAFARRLDYILEFREPGAEERAALWRAHLPQSAPLDPDVDLQALARLYQMVGGQIRNACLSAAYFAAAEDRSISQDHLVRGVRREYEKYGRAFREVAPERRP